jgi:hypothetical protein
MRQFVASAWRSTLAIALELNRALTQAERDAEARERDRSESVFQTREF